MRTATKSVNLIIQREKKQEQKKKTNLQVPNNFLYIYLPLFCMTTCHCFARLNRKIFWLHIILMEECCMCSPKILLLVFLYTFTRLEINARNWAKSNVPLLPVLLFKICARSFCFFRARSRNRSGFPFLR